MNIDDANKLAIEKVLNSQPTLVSIEKAGNIIPSTSNFLLVRDTIVYLAYNFPAFFKLIQA